MKTKLDDGRFLVHHTGNEDAGIEGTGQKRYMSEEQFELLKHKGWSVVPEANSPETTKAETGSDSDKKSDEPKAETSMDFAATEAIGKIKELGKANDLDGIQNFVDPKENRVTVKEAADRFLNPTNEEES